MYLPAFGLNSERYEVSLCIHSECGKILTRKTPNTDTFDVVVREIIKGKKNFSYTERRKVSA